MDLGLKGKTVIVTGGSRGVGGGISEAFAAEGAKVVMDDLGNDEEGQRYAEQLSEKYDTEAYLVVGDISNPDDVKHVFDFAEEKTGSVDVLVNCAGLTGGSTNGIVGELSIETFRRNLEVNLVGTFQMTTEFVNRVQAEGHGGRIVNILSKASRSTTTKGHTCLTLTKSALEGFTRQCAVDLTDKGIIVNGIMPGSAFNSRFVGSADQMADPKTQARLARLPLHRFAQPIEIGRNVCWLASEQCSLAVGSIVDATGGLLT
jgi:NAD(P)-dependent dehydrogenase (short-subunit alcohol dehydrogenase family)